MILVFEKENTPLFKRILDKETMIIGRSPEADIQLVAPDISRIHCVLEKTPVALILTDRSRNGTLLNNRKIRRAGVSAGDQLQIGPWNARFLRPEENAGETVARRGRNEKKEGVSFCGMLGKSPRTLAVFDLLRKAAASNATVCLIGESGTGKELSARSLHDLSERREKPFIAINCGAIPSNLIESLLFGHERGAFTGASERSIGVLEQAHTGTLFLDEIGEMPLELQTRLLRVLETKTVRRVGGRTDLNVDFRLIAATNKNLEAEVAAGRFREDLFYRLFIFPVLLPPLRDRREDIPVLIRHFLGTLACSQKKPLRLTLRALWFLREREWPGNIRELKNICQRLLLLFPEETVGRRELEKILPQPPPGNGGPRNMREREKEILIETLARNKGNVSQSARQLGLSRTTILDRLKRFGMSASNWR